MTPSTRAALLRAPAVRLSRDDGDGIGSFPVLPPCEACAKMTPIGLQSSGISGVSFRDGQPVLTECAACHGTGLHPGVLVIEPAMIDIYADFYTRPGDAPVWLTPKPGLSADGKLWVASDPAPRVMVARYIPGHVLLEAGYGEDDTTDNGTHRKINAAKDFREQMEAAGVRWPDGMIAVYRAWRVE